MNKIIFTLFLLCAFVFTAKSQSLQFSQVLLVSSLDTVPQDKVWKITSYLGEPDFFTGNGSVKIKINGVENAIATRQCPYNGYNACFTETIPFPLWFNSNTTLEVSTGCQNLSVIEFTVTQ